MIGRPFPKDGFNRIKGRVVHEGGSGVEIGGFGALVELGEGWEGGGLGGLGGEHQESNRYNKENPDIRK